MDGPNKQSGANEENTKGNASMVADQSNQSTNQLNDHEKERKKYER
jgi:hypothetical protein